MAKLKNENMDIAYSSLEISKDVRENFKKIFDELIVLLLLGPPACGKGTQAKKIKDVVTEVTDNHTILITTGDLCKSFLDAGSDISPKACNVLKERMNNQGKLLPTHIKVFLWTRDLLAQMHEPEKDNLIFDGSPRDIDEAKALVDALEFWGRKCMVLKFDVSDDELLRRIKEKDRGREDDKGDTPQKRIIEYKLKLPELLNFFEMKNIPVVEFNAVGGIKEVFEKISWQLKFASYKLK